MAGVDRARKIEGMELFDFASFRVVVAGLSIATAALLVGIVGDALAHRIALRRRS